MLRQATVIYPRPNAKCSRPSYRPFSGPTEPLRRGKAFIRAPDPPSLSSALLSGPFRAFSFYAKYWIVPKTISCRDKKISNDTNSYEPARPDGMWTTVQARLWYGRVQPFASTVRGCSLISTVFGPKSPRGWGREEGRVGEGGSPRRSVPYLQSPVWCERERERGWGGAEGCTVTAWEM